MDNIYSTLRRVSRLNFDLNFVQFTLKSVFGASIDHLGLSGNCERAISTGARVRTYPTREVSGGHARKIILLLGDYVEYITMLEHRNRVNIVL